MGGLNPHDHFPYMFSMYGSSGTFPLTLSRMYSKYPTKIGAAHLFLFFRALYLFVFLDRLASLCLTCEIFSCSKLLFTKSWGRIARGVGMQLVT